MTPRISAWGLMGYETRTWRTGAWEGGRLGCSKLSMPAKPQGQIPRRQLEIEALEPGAELRATDISLSICHQLRSGILSPGPG